MSVANITLHYTLLPAADTINRAVIFKRFIDDIMWLSYDVDTTNEIQNLVSFTFEENKLEVLFRRICTEENQQQSRMEFLDVEHQIDSKSVAGFFEIILNLPQWSVLSFMVNPITLLQYLNL